MKEETQIRKFFNTYKTDLLPQDQEKFMQELKQNMERLPRPSAFEQEHSDEDTAAVCRRILKRMRKEEKRRKWTVVLNCIFAILSCGVVLASTVGLSVPAGATSSDLSGWFSAVILLSICVLPLLLTAERRL